MDELKPLLRVLLKRKHPDWFGSYITTLTSSYWLASGPNSRGLGDILFSLISSLTTTELAPFLLTSGFYAHSIAPARNGVVGERFEDLLSLLIEVFAYMFSSGLLSQVFGKTSLDMNRSALWNTGFV